MNTMTMILTASAQWGQNAAKWGLDQMMWIALLGGLAGVAFCAVKKNVVGTLVVGALTAIVCYFMKNPETLVKIGEALAKVAGF